MNPLQSPRSLGRVALVGVALCAASFCAAQSTVELIQGQGKVIELPNGTETIFIGNPAIANTDVISSRSAYVTGVAPGETQMIISDANDDELAEYVLHVHSASTAASNLQSGLTSEQRGDIAILRGIASDPGDAQSVATAQNAFEAEGVTAFDDTEYHDPRQVSLRVKFVEASRSEMRRLGINLSAIGSSFRAVTGGPNPTAFLLNGASGVAAIGGRFDIGSTNVDVLIDALEQKGAAQVLSEPTLTTVSGRRASFHAGGEIGYPVSQGENGITAEFKSYGVSIDFLPTILPNDRIALEVKPSVSNLDPSNSVQVDGFQVPGVTRRAADTTIELGSGQTFAIAGLYEQFSNRNSSGVPGLSRLLGGKNESYGERELIIFITPYLSSPADVASPRRSKPNLKRTVGFVTR